MSLPELESEKDNNNNNNNNQQVSPEIPKKKVDPQKVEMYILSHKNYFPSNKLIYLKTKMLNLDEKEFDLIYFTKLKSPDLIFLVSVFFGVFGIDRFMIKDIAIAILKLFTFSLCLTLWFYDLFTIAERVKKINFETIIILL